MRFPDDLKVVAEFEVIGGMVFLSALAAAGLNHEIEFGRLSALLDRVITMRRLRQTVSWSQMN
jgi:hypothetical protein